MTTKGLNNKCIKPMKSLLFLVIASPTVCWAYGSFSPCSVPPAPQYDCGVDGNCVELNGEESCKCENLKVPDPTFPSPPELFGAGPNCDGSCDLTCFNGGQCNVRNGYNGNKISHFKQCVCKAGYTDSTCNTAQVRDWQVIAQW